MREAVGVFDDPQRLQAAIDELEQNGFMRHELSILAPQGTEGRELAQSYAHVSQAVDDPRAPRTVFMPEEIIGELEGSAIGIPLYISAIAGTCIVAGMGGTLLATLAAAAAAGAGGAAIGTLLAKYIAKNHAEQLQEHLARGGFLLWAAVRDEGQEKACKAHSFPPFRAATSTSTKFRCPRGIKMPAEDAQCAAQAAHVDGLGQVHVETGFLRLASILVPSVPRQRHDKGRAEAVVAAHRARDRVSVDAGPADIAQDNLRLELPGRSDAVRTGIGRADIVPFLLQQHARRLRCVKIIFDDENTPPGRYLGHCNGRRNLFRGGFRRQANGEAGALAKALA